MSLAIRLGKAAPIIASITVGSRSTVSFPQELLPLPVAPTGPVEARLAQALHGGVQPPDITANFPTTVRVAGRRAWLFLWVLAINSCAVAPREDEGSQAEASPRRVSSQWLRDAPRGYRALIIVPKGSISRCQGRSCVAAIRFAAFDSLCRGRHCEDAITVFEESISLWQGSRCLAAVC